MIRRVLALRRRVSIRQLLRDPRAELGRILGWLGRRVERLGTGIGSRGSVMPAWLDEEMVALAGVEPLLLGDHGNTSRYRHYAIPAIVRPGELYRALVAELAEPGYSHVMVLPWLVRGGADRGALYHLRAWVEKVPANEILVILTEPVDSPWIEQVPAGVKVLQFGRLVGGMGLDTQVQLLTRLLVQLQPAVIHNINSRVAWHALSRYGLALRQRSRWFASLFCDDQDENGVPVGYARTYLRSCYPHLCRVFSDNAVYPARWTAELGIPGSLFAVVRFPYDRPIVQKEDPFELPGHPRVLWAGRFHRQKRPDILLAVALAMPDVLFDVHGASELGASHPAIGQLRLQPNVIMHGPFARFEDIVRPDHAAYLFTTSWEGLPTILLDAAAAGLPVVAPAVGGISDIVDRSVLVADPDDVEGYVKQLRALVTDSELRRRRRRRQYLALSEGRNWEDFIRSISTMDFYLPGPCQADRDTSEQGSRT